MGSLVLVFAIIFFFIAYKTYGGYLSAKFSIDDSHPTPSHTNNDGVDFVPAKKTVLLGHHFASIAGVGPIVGPVLAVSFGWAPVYIWILVGAVFFGGVHDYATLVASIRHKGKSIGVILEDFIGISGKRLFLIFAYATLILVIAVFAIVITKTFVNIPQVGASSILFIIAAIIFGLILYKANLPLWISTIFGLILLAGSIWLGQIFPLVLSGEVWMITLFGYVFIASVVPVWILLQPRDYLNSYFLYIILIGGVIGVVFSIPEIHAPAVTTFEVSKLGYLFPALFVTVACGALSGFHSIVSSGTTSKQINKESDAKLIGYGGMLIEGVLAVLAMLSVATLTSGEYIDMLESEGAVSAFSTGVANFFDNIPLLHLQFEVGKSFVALGVAAFALTTLDTSTRLARYLFQEFFADSESKTLKTFHSNRYIGTLFTVLLAGSLTFSGQTMTIWPVFGSANQLLAALALLTITLWMSSLKLDYKFSFIPLVFMLLVTLSALVALFYNNLFVSEHYSLAILSILLFTLAVLLVIEAYKYLFLNKKENL